MGSDEEVYSKELRYPGVYMPVDIDVSVAVRKSSPELQKQPDDVHELQSHPQGTLEPSELSPNLSPSTDFSASLSHFSPGSWGYTSERSYLPRSEVDWAEIARRREHDYESTISESESSRQPDTPDGVSAMADERLFWAGPAIATSSVLLPGADEGAQEGEKEEEGKGKKVVVMEAKEEENKKVEEYDEGPQTAVFHQISSASYIDQQGRRFQIPDIEPDPNCHYPHRRVVFDLGAKGYMCDSEHKPNSNWFTFLRISELNRHYRSAHSGLKPYVCPVCGSTFARNDVRKNHLRVHPDPG